MDTGADAGIRRVSDKGWVVIPQELRQRYGLEKGTPVRFVDYGGVLSIFPVPDNPIRHGYGMLRGRQLTRRLLHERRQDQAREDASQAPGP